MRRSVSLFAGVGMLDLAAHSAGYETTLACEIEEYPSKILAKRFPQAELVKDVRELKGGDLGHVDCLHGGSPCQGFSSAGLGLALKDPRSKLIAEFLRLIGEAQPRIALIENVAVLRSRGLDNIIGVLASMGYGCWWDCVPALAVGAPHLRDRVWITCVHFEDMPELPGKPFKAITTKMPRAGASTIRGLIEMKPEATIKMCKEAMGAVKREDGTTWLTKLDSPLFPTPSASSYGSNQGGTAGRTGPVSTSLAHMAKHRLWPTAAAADGARGPDLSDVRPSGAKGTVNLLGAVTQEARMWPTASARDYKDMALGDGAIGRGQIPEAIPDGLREAQVFPTPRSASDDRGGRGDLIQVVRGNKNDSSHGNAGFNGPAEPDSDNDVRRLGPPALPDLPGPCDAVAALGVGHNADETRVWPTPRASANELRTRSSAPSHGVSHGLVLSGAGGDAEIAAGRAVPPSSGSAGPLNPAFVEWLMGIPFSWTDIDCDDPIQLDWLSEYGIPRVLRDVPYRKERLVCCGNSLVHQVAYTRIMQAHRLLGIE